MMGHRFLLPLLILHFWQPLRHSFNKREAFLILTVLIYMVSAAIHAMGVDQKSKSQKSPRLGTGLWKLRSDLG